MHGQRAPANRSAWWRGVPGDAHPSAVAGVGPVAEMDAEKVVRVVFFVEPMFGLRCETQRYLQQNFRCI